MCGDFHHAERTDHGVCDANAETVLRRGGCAVRFVLVVLEPADTDAAADQPRGGIVDGAEMGARAGHDGEEAAELVAFVVRGILELGVGKERVKDSEVGVAKRVGGEGEVE